MNGISSAHASVGYMYMFINLLFNHLAAEVEILFPGMVTTVTVNETDAVNLTCGARGSPEPTFIWYIGEDEASEALISSVSSGDIPDFIYVNSTLSISSAVPEDRNIYTCTASNSIYGLEITDSQEYSLIVNCKIDCYIFLILMSYL